jgi:hypothetical protein
MINREGANARPSCGYTSSMLAICRYIGVFEADIVGAAREIANVSHTFQPSGLLLR